MGVWMHWPVSRGICIWRSIELIIWLKDWAWTQAFGPLNLHRPLISLVLCYPTLTSTHYTLMSLGCGRKPELLEEAHTSTASTCRYTWGQDWTQVSGAVSTICATVRCHSVTVNKGACIDRNLWGHWFSHHCASSSSVIDSWNWLWHPSLPTASRAFCLQDLLGLSRKERLLSALYLLYRRLHCAVAKSRTLFCFALFHQGLFRHYNSAWTDTCPD